MKSIDRGFRRFHRYPKPVIVPVPLSVTLCLFLNLGGIARRFRQPQIILLGQSVGYAEICGDISETINKRP